MGRWLIRANFGKVDGNPKDTTIPGWLLGEEGRARILAREKGDRGIKPDGHTDIGRLAGELPARQPGRKGGGWERRVHRGGGHRRKYENKQLHYQPLMEELEREGWNVRGKIHVITVGVRATVSTRNDEVLKEMGVSEKRDRKSLQQDL
eukprot:1191330-Prorocentrum_minimum.AAC.3